MTASLEGMREETTSVHTQLLARADSNMREFHAKVDFLESETHELINFKAKVNEFLPGFGEKGDQLQSLRNLLVLLTTLQSELMATIKGVNTSMAAND